MNQTPFFLVFLAVSFSSLAQLTDEQLIRNARLESNKGIKEKNIDTISKFWLPDFVQIRGNGTYQVGRDAIIELWKESFKSSPQTSYVRNATEVVISENDPTLAWEKGTWEGINSYSKGGVYSAMWKKKNDEWKLQAEMFVALK